MDAPGGIAAALLSGCFTALLAYLNDGTDFGLVEIYVRRLRHEGGADAPAIKPGFEFADAIAFAKKKSDPNGIRTRVTAVKGRCPRPLDDRVRKAGQYQKCTTALQGELPARNE